MRTRRYVLLCVWRCYAGVAELADALGLGSSEVTRGGSSPLTRTIFYSM